MNLASRLLAAIPFLASIPLLPAIPSGVFAARDVATPRAAGEVAPEAAGMDAARLAEIDSAIEAAIADGATPGAALAVGRGDTLVRLRGYGRIDWIEGSAAAAPDTLYDLASLTKAVGTTTGLMRLVEEKRLDLDAPVSAALDWFRGGGKDAITARDLLLHGSGLPAHLALWKSHQGKDGFRDALASLETETPPGERTAYSDLGFLVLGFLVEDVSGAPLDAFLRERVFEPLGMSDTTFRPDASLLPRAAPTERDETWRRRHLRGEVHDENAFAMGGVAGNAGLFSTASDLAKFGRAILAAARAAGVEGDDAAPPATPFFPATPETVLRFTTRADESSSRALGWDTPDERCSCGSFFTSRAFGHTGFTGTSLWVDPELDLFVVLLTNRVNPTRAHEKHVALRRAVHDAAALAIADRPVGSRAAAVDPDASGPSRVGTPR